MDQKPQTQQLIPAAFSKENVPAGQIGYYNASRSPLTFTSQFANRGQTTVQPGEAVLNMHNRLVQYDPDLERMVRDSCLKRIIPADPRFKHFKELEERNTKKQGIATVSKADVVVTGSLADTSDARKLDYTTENVDGVDYFLYDGQRFTSASAMNAYARSKGHLD